jgi:integrase/recombinase XerD
VGWTGEIKLPSEPTYYPKKVSENDINDALKYFEEREYYIRVKALILLGSTSGLRAEELYQLTTDNIDINNRTIYINHNPTNGQSTKTKKSRVSFFNKQTQQALHEYINHFNSNINLKVLFSQGRMEKLFKDAPIKVKDLRKYFSQEWDRRGGPTSIKKILMGHSLKGDVDLMHYNYQSEEDLKQIYDKVMGGD